MCVITYYMQIFCFPLSFENGNAGTTVKNKIILCDEYGDCVDVMCILCRIGEGYVR